MQHCESRFQSHNSLQCLSLQEAAFHQATAAGWRFLKLTTTFHSEWHFWNEGRGPRQKPRPLASTVTHKWISFCTYPSKTMKLRNGCKRNCCSAEIALNVSEEEVFVQYTSNRSGYLYHLFISEEESLWRKNCEQSFDICFNKSSLSSSLHLSLVPFHLLIWRD